MVHVISIVNFTTSCDEIVAYKTLLHQPTLPICTYIHRCRVLDNTLTAVSRVIRPATPPGRARRKTSRFTSQEAKFRATPRPLEG